MKAADHNQTEYVLIARVDQSHGFFSMGDVIAQLAPLNENGLDMIVEQAPGSYMDMAVAFYIKANVEQLEQAKAAWREVMQTRGKA